MANTGAFHRILVALSLALAGAAWAQQGAKPAVEMQWLPASDTRFEWVNAVDLEPRDGGLQPVRVARAWRDKWSQPNQRRRATSSAGVSLRFRTDSPRIVFRATLLDTQPFPAATNPEDAWEFNRPPYFAVYKNGKFVASVPGKIQAGQQEVPLVNAAPAAPDLAEYQILLPFYYRNAETILNGVGVAPGSKVEAAAPDRRPRVLFFGDSITHGHGVTAPQETYVWQACRIANCVPLNFGFGGTGWGEQVVADTIAARDDWDVLVIAIGTNSFSGTDGATQQRETAPQYGEKYWRFIETVRDRWPTKPIIAMTPVLNRYDILGIVNANGETAQMYREAITRVVRERQRRDRNLRLLDGLAFVGEPLHLLVTDLVHPNDWGMRRMGEGVAAALKPLMRGAAQTKKTPGKAGTS